MLTLSDRDCLDASELARIDGSGFSDHDGLRVSFKLELESCDERWLRNYTPEAIWDEVNVCIPRLADFTGMAAMLCSNVENPPAPTRRRVFTSPTNRENVAVSEPPRKACFPVKAAPDQVRAKI
jgi:hypothetical protein